MITESRSDGLVHLIRRSDRGHLKIYLGYCTGVGTTYAMLQEGRRLKAEGADVVIGAIDTSGRTETEMLVAGLERIPPRKVVFHGIEIEEMSLDAIFERKPAVVLIDELAHTNVPGSKNDRRYQDVEEILAMGIRVISTLNIQHLESLYDTVEKMVQMRVRDRIPDRILAEADQIVNVDITPEDLLTRLKNRPFSVSSLQQLRELTLRELASQIDSRRRTPIDREITSAPDQVMICLSSRGPNSEKLLRYASRLAGRLNRNWYAVYVQTDSERSEVIDEKTQGVLSNTLALAKQLGAMVFTYRGEDVVKTILAFAKEYLVGHIIVGSSDRQISPLGRLFGQRTVVEQLIRESSNHTIVVVDTGDPGAASAGAVASLEQEASLARLLTANRILFWDEAITKESALRQLAHACAEEIPGLTEEEIHRAVLEREKHGSTFLNEAIALPHARFDSLRRAVLAVAIATRGVDDLTTRTSARVVFYVLTPAEFPEIQVRILGAVGKLALDAPSFSRLIHASTPETVLSILDEYTIRL